MANCWQVKARDLGLIRWNTAAAGRWAKDLGISLRLSTTSQVWRIWATASWRLAASTTPDTRSPPA